jgi:demethylmacrocin O-methyltransferase
VRARWAGDLPALATHFGTDKWNSHWYADRYQKHFGPLRRRRLRLLEIGVGGYDDPRAGGASLRMWKAYFPRARIFGLDLADKRAHDEPRIRTLVGSQTDAALLEELSRRFGPFDIVIDDGSHVNADVVRTFQILFPLLAPEGMYVIEDLQTAYWPEYGGAPAGEHGAATSMNFLKDLVDGLNHREFPRDGTSRAGPFDGSIVGMHFYHNLAFIQKGVNDEPSNILDRDA